MTNKEPIQVDGLPRLKRDFQSLEKAARRKVLRSVLRRAAVPVRTRARKELDIRDRTGFLRKNIAITVSAISDVVAVATIGMRRKAFYGGFFELGTAFFPARPWLVPAFIKSRNLIVERFAKAMKAELLKAIRK